MTFFKVCKCYKNRTINSNRLWHEMPTTQANLNAKSGISRLINFVNIPLLELFRQRKYDSFSNFENLYKIRKKNYNPNKLAYKNFVRLGLKLWRIHTLFSVDGQKMDTHTDTLTHTHTLTDGQLFYRVPLPEFQNAQIKFQLDRIKTYSCPQKKPIWK